MSGGEIVKINLIVSSVFHELAQLRLFLVDENLVFISAAEKIKSLKFLGDLEESGLTTILTSQEISEEHISNITRLHD